MTSLSATDLPLLGYKNISIKQLVLERASMAQEAGCAGVICSGEEIAAVRKECGINFKIVVPGIRPAGLDVRQDDQSRIITPRDAIRDGADYIVVGRPIRDAKNPKDAAIQINKEIQTALEGQ